MIVLSSPLGIFAVFIVMKLQGVNANIMSLGGIAIGAMGHAARGGLSELHMDVVVVPCGAAALEAEFVAAVAEPRLQMRLDENFADARIV